jgi:hypothetical protein
VEHIVDCIRVKKKLKKTLPLGDLGVLSAKPRGRDRRHITYTRNDFKRGAGRVYKKKTNVEVTLLGLKKMRQTLKFTAKEQCGSIFSKGGLKNMK